MIRHVEALMNNHKSPHKAVEVKKVSSGKSIIQIQKNIQSQLNTNTRII